MANTELEAFVKKDSRLRLKWGNRYAILSYALLIMGAIAIPFVIWRFGVKSGILIIVLLAGIPTAIYTIFNLKFGVIVLLSFTFFLSRLIFLAGDIPLGIIIDVFLLLMLIGLVIRKSKRNDWNLAKGPISYLVWIWLIYNGIELLNPMASMEAWIYVIRGIAGHMIFYFIVLEAMDDLAFFKKLIAVWIVLAFLGAAYGIFQEFHGLLDSEKAWVMSSEERYKLFFNWGRFRIFSFFNDPTVFGLLMSFTSLFCLTLLSAPIRFSIKIALAIAAATMFLAIVYTGTRTAYAMLPAGFVFFALITFQKKTIALTGIILALGAGIVFSDIRNLGPFLSTNSLERIRSAFKPTEDKSYLVRVENQARIKPFIQSHPIGAGLGSVGVQGEKFNPNSPVAGFAPDSTYVRIAVELGWIGLLIYSLLIIVVLVIGIRNYYSIKSPEIKAYMAGLLAVIYCITIANYPQQAAIQLPSVLIFYALIASIVKLKELDSNYKIKI